MVTHKMLAHALDDENGAGTGGAHGDQKGYELCCCPWYSYPWIAVYRPVDENGDRDEDKANAIALFMERAVTNGFFGYNQNRNRRKEFFDVLAAVEFFPEYVTENVSTDCSGLVYTAVYSAYHIEGLDSYVTEEGNTLYRIPKTGNMDDYLLNVVGGFTKCDGAEYLESADNLMRGDILLADGHIAVWV